MKRANEKVIDGLTVRGDFFIGIHEMRHSDLSDLIIGLLSHIRFCDETYGERRSSFDAQSIIKKWEEGKRIQYYPPRK